MGTVASGYSEGLSSGACRFTSLHASYAVELRPAAAALRWVCSLGDSSYSIGLNSGTCNYNVIIIVIIIIRSYRPDLPQEHLLQDSRYESVLFSNVKMGPAFDWSIRRETASRVKNIVQFDFKI